MATAPCSDCSPLTTTPCEPDLVSLDRRHVLTQGVLAAVAATLSACASQHPTPAATPVPLGTWTLRIRPADFPALAAANGVARVDGESTMPVAVVRTTSGYAAFSLRCTHAGGTLEWKSDQGLFVCPRHGAEFRNDGTWAGGHQATNLKALATTYDASTETLTITAS